MRRREFLGIVGGAAAASVARAQQLSYGSSLGAVYRQMGVTADEVSE
jgi:hypothetical protein